jgi:hypothetical protein
MVDSIRPSTPPTPGTPVVKGVDAVKQVEIKKENLVPIGKIPGIGDDEMDLKHVHGHAHCIPPIDNPFPPHPPIDISEGFEEFKVKTQGVTGTASVEEDFMGHEQVYVTDENGKRYRLTGDEAEAVRAAVKAAEPFEKVEVTVKGDLSPANRMHGVPTIDTDSVSIDVKPSFVHFDHNDIVKPLIHKAKAELDEK